MPCLVGGLLAKFFLIGAGLLVLCERLLKFGLRLSRLDIRAGPERRVWESAGGLPFEPVGDVTVWQNFASDGLKGPYGRVFRRLDYVGLYKSAAAAQDLLIGRDCTGGPVARLESPLKYLEPVCRGADEYLLPAPIGKADLHLDAAKQRPHEAGDILFLIAHGLNTCSRPDESGPRDILSGKGPESRNCGVLSQ